MIRVFISILTYDIWFYISHVMLHSKYLYKYHSIHHSKVIPTWRDTYLAHPLEGPFQGVGMFVPYLIYDYTALDTIIILAILNCRGLMRHDARFNRIVGNHHLLHHQYQKYNYGEAWIDRLLGTCLTGPISSLTHRDDNTAWKISE